MPDTCLILIYFVHDITKTWSISSFHTSAAIAIHKKTNFSHSSAFILQQTSLFIGIFLSKLSIFLWIFLVSDFSVTDRDHISFVPLHFLDLLLHLPSLTNQFCRQFLLTLWNNLALEVLLVYLHHLPNSKWSFFNVSLVCGDNLSNIGVVYDKITELFKITFLLHNQTKIATKGQYTNICSVKVQGNSHKLKIPLWKQ